MPSVVILNIPTVLSKNILNLDIVRTVYHLVINMQSNKIHKVFNE